MTDDVVRAGDADSESGDEAACEDWSSAKRIEQQTLWVDMQVRNAMQRGAFDNLPGAGKPIPGLGGQHDPDWWAKQLIEREEITGLAPPAIALRTEHAQLDDRLDRESSESEVRRILVDFNDRVVYARRQLQGGPPVVTPTRDIEAEVAAWKARREDRRAAQRRQLEQMREGETSGKRPPRRRRWWRRG
jgi:hypothetical protein